MRLPMRHVSDTTRSAALTTFLESSFTDAGMKGVWVHYPLGDVFFRWGKRSPGEVPFLYWQVYRLFRVAIMWAFGSFAITDFILARFIGYIISDVRIWLFYADNGAFLVFTDATFDIFAFLRIYFYIPGGVARRFNGLDDIFDFFPDVTFRYFYCFEVAFAIDLTARDRVRASFDAFARRVHIRVFGRFFVAAFDGASRVFVNGDRYANDFCRFFGFALQLLTLEARFEDFVAFICVATCYTGPFLFRLYGFLLIMWSGVIMALIVYSLRV